MPKIAGINVIKRVRYFCHGCTGIVTYAPEAYSINYAVCSQCGKVTDSSNYKEENWIAMGEEEIAEVNS